METQIKKSAVDLTDLAIGLIVLGIIVSIGATIMITVRDARLTSLPTVLTSNETLSGVNDSVPSAYTNKWVSSVTRFTNATDGVIIPTSNYTTSISEVDGTGHVTPVASSGYFSGQDWNVTYNWYNTSKPDYKVANDAAVGLGEYGNWFKIIVIVGVAAVILALIFMAFGNRGGQGNPGGSY